MRKVLVALESPDLRDRVEALLHGRSLETAAAPRTQEAAVQAAGLSETLIIECSARNYAQSLATVELVRSTSPWVRIVLIATIDSEDTAIRALKLGVTDYFKLPLPAREFVESVERCVSAGNATKDEPGLATEFASLVGVSAQFQELREYLARVSRTDASVLITGETGTGKELVAEAIHASSPRRGRPFVCVNCAAIPDSLIESELFGFERGAFTGAQSARQGKLQTANSGSIFLDEVGDLSSLAQAKVLRAIETKEIHPLGAQRAQRLDFRIIAATNRNIESIQQDSGFRRDLFFRLNVARIALPPLRERACDIPVLLDYFIHRFNKLFGRQVERFAANAVAALMSYDWPGNVRELRNVVEAAFVNLPIHEVAELELPENLRAACAGNVPVGERERLMHVLFATNWNVSRAAGQLHWSRMTMYRKMTKYRLSRAASPALSLKAAAAL